MDVWVDELGRLCSCLFIYPESLGWRAFPYIIRCVQAYLPTQLPRHPVLLGVLAYRRLLFHRKGGNKENLKKFNIFAILFLPLFCCRRGRFRRQKRYWEGVG